MEEKLDTFMESVNLKIGNLESMVSNLAVLIQSSLP
jgi:hypothetical protein